MAPPIRVLIVDDSDMARAMLRAIFESDPAFEIVAEAANGAEAVDMVKQARPDLITMDLEMPKMDGISAITDIMSTRPTPILVVSDSTNARHAYEAVAHGAVDVVAKPVLAETESRKLLDRARLVASIPVIRHVKPQCRNNRPATSASPKTVPPVMVADSSKTPVFAIASSTGGPQALRRILSQLPKNFSSPVLISQHIITGFAEGLAAWLAKESGLPVKLAEQDEKTIPGHVYLSPSEAHLSVVRAGRIELLALREGDTYHPSCDILLESVANIYGRRGVGIVLTGMGSDGAKGLARIKAAGGTTLAQDEASSVIYGMNRVAIESGAVDRVLPPEEIAAAMVQMANNAARP